MKEAGALALAALAAGRAKAKAKDVRAPTKRSIVRPVFWSTKGVETCEAEDVGSSPGRAKVMAKRETSRVMRRNVVDCF